MHYEIFSNNNIPGWVKRADKRSQNCQALVVKATAGLIKLFENLLNAEKQLCCSYERSFVLDHGVDAVRTCKFLYE